MPCRPPPRAGRRKLTPAKVKKIALASGGHALVDAENYNRLSKWTWKQCGFCKHVYRVIKTGKENYEIVYLASDVISRPDAGLRGACNPCPPIPD